MRMKWFFFEKKLNSLHPRMLCAKFGWNWSSDCGEKYFFISSMYVRYFVIISPWKRAGPLIWIKLNLLHTRLLCAKFCWNLLCGSGEEEFLILLMYFRFFGIISPWKRAGPFIWTKLNPFTRRCILPSLVEIGSVVLQKIFFNYFNVFYYSQLSPLGRGQNPSFEQNWIPVTQECFVSSLVEIGVVVLEKKSFYFFQCIFAIS